VTGPEGWVGARRSCDQDVGSAQFSRLPRALSTGAPRANPRRCHRPRPTRRRGPGTAAAAGNRHDELGTEATGFGPRGPVNLSVTKQGERTEVQGTWNGAPAHLVFDPCGLRGSLVVRRGRTAAEEISCSYQLERREPGGALVGFSTCAGMPQDARLEVDAAIQTVLSPPELAVFLVAALAAPPFAPREWR
jgi:hypothetical protein